MALFSAVANMFNTVISAWVRNYLEDYIKDFGTIDSLQLDFNKKTLACRLRLQGDSDPVDVNISGIHVCEQKGKSCFGFEELHVSREWIEKLYRRYAAKHLAENPIVLPDKVALLMKKVF